MVPEGVPFCRHRPALTIYLGSTEFGPSEQRPTNLGAKKGKGPTSGIGWAPKCGDPKCGTRSVVMKSRSVFSVVREKAVGRRAAQERKDGPREKQPTQTGNKKNDEMRRTLECEQPACELPTIIRTNRRSQTHYELRLPQGRKALMCPSLLKPIRSQNAPGASQILAPRIVTRTFEPP